MSELVSNASTQCEPPGSRVCWQITPRHKILWPLPPPLHLQMRQHAPNNHILDLVVICMLSPLWTSLSRTALLLLWLHMAILMPRWMDDQTATCWLHLKMGQHALNNHVPWPGCYLNTVSSLAYTIIGDARDKQRDRTSYDDEWQMTTATAPLNTTGANGGGINVDGSWGVGARGANMDWGGMGCECWCKGCEWRNPWCEHGHRRPGGVWWMEWGVRCERGHRWPRGAWWMEWGVRCECGDRKSVV